MSNEERIETLKELCRNLKSDIQSYTELYDAKMIALNSNLDVIYSDENVQNSPELKILTKEYVNSILNEIKNILTSRMYHNKVIMDEAKKILYRLHKMESITDEEFDILLQAVNRNDGMFHYTETTTTYPEGCPCPCRPC